MKHARQGKEQPLERRLVIRPLTEDVVQEVVAVHRAAYAQYINSRLGDAYAEAFLEWFRKAPGAIALVALECERSAAGYVVGAPGNLRRSRNLALLPIVIRQVLSRPWLLADRRLAGAIRGRLRLLLPRAARDYADVGLPTPRMDLVSIAVAPGKQKRGCGALLVNAFEASARSREIRSMRLFVERENAAARRLYEQAGWRLLEAPQSSEGLLQYAKILDDGDHAKPTTSGD